jgi:hypothetical protein
MEIQFDIKSYWCIKVSGTVKGTIMAGIKIGWILNTLSNNMLQLSISFLPYIACLYYCFFMVSQLNLLINYLKNQKKIKSIQFDFTIPSKSRSYDSIAFF